jgi:hypothetical protein
MARLFLASTAVVSALAMFPFAVEAQKPTPKKDALPKSNQVYVKIIMPFEPAKRDKDQLVVESWIAEHIMKRGQSKFTAATAWVPLTDKEEYMGRRFTRVWNGTLDGEYWGCPTTGQIVERADGRIKVLLWGWGPGGDQEFVSLTDEPGSRAVAAAKHPKKKDGVPYVAVLIGPPPE